MHRGNLERNFSMKNVVKEEAEKKKGACHHEF
jgi:hypothetical protein